MPDTTAPELSDADKEQADVLIERLKKESEYVAWQYMSSHVPAAWQAYFLASNPDPSQPPPEAQSGSQTTAPAPAPAA